MSRVITDMGHHVTYTHTIKEGLNRAKTDDYDVVFLDVRLPDGNGLAHLPSIQATRALPEVIILTGYAEPDGAELAIKNNAWDYIKKPASIDSITLSISRAIQYREEKKASKPVPILKREGIIGSSPQMASALDLVARAANSMANVLIIGETGTGKELFARAIHANSPRSETNFVAVDCGSLPETLMESLLFGHAKGAFTGANRAEIGFIKHADGGTLFLDEIGNLPLSMQKGFLRVIQERRFHPIGETQEITSDFRLIAASNRSLDDMVKTGHFREDLLFRIRSIKIELPPLRDRPEDIKDLAVQYLRTISEPVENGMKGFSPEFLEVLTTYEWPGNVRELHSALESALAQALYEPTLFPKHLPEHIRIQVARSSFEEPASIEGSGNQYTGEQGQLTEWKAFRKTIVSDGERRYLRELISKTGGNIKEASRLSGLSQPRLYELLRKHGISL